MASQLNLNVWLDNVGDAYGGLRLRIANVIRYIKNVGDAYGGLRLRIAIVRHHIANVIGHIKNVGDYIALVSDAYGGLRLRIAIVSSCVQDASCDFSCRVACNVEVGIFTKSGVGHLPLWGDFTNACFKVCLSLIDFCPNRHIYRAYFCNASEIY